MVEEKVLEGRETEICQIGVVVKDLDKTIEYLTALGLGPFSVRTVLHSSVVLRGEKVSYEVRMGKSQQGPVELELIEYQKGKTIQKEFLDQRGEGLHHIKFEVRDLHTTLEKFARKGIRPLQEDQSIRGGMAYMGTDDIGGIIMEIRGKPID